MARTPEQTAADDALNAAVQTAAIAYGFPERAIVTDYIVTLSAQTWHDDGDTDSEEGVLMRNGNIPGYRAKGLAAFAVDAINECTQYDTFVPYADDGDDE